MQAFAGEVRAYRDEVDRLKAEAGDDNPFCRTTFFGAAAARLGAPGRDRAGQDPGGARGR